MSWFGLVLSTSVVALATFLAGLLLGWWLGAVRAGEGEGGLGRRRRDDRIVLYVGNLPYRAREGDLRKLFRQSGRVVSARVIRNRFNGESKGYGFVEMGSKAEADQAVKGLNGTEFQGRQIVVSEAKSAPKDE